MNIFWKGADDDVDDDDDKQISSDFDILVIFKLNKSTKSDIIL